MKTFDVIGLGAHNIDLLKKNTDVVMAPGGAAANTIVGLSKLGLRTGIVGKIGYDDRLIIESFKNNNVDYSHLTQDVGTPTGYGYVTINKKGQRTISYNTGANSLLEKNVAN